MSGTSQLGDQAADGLEDVGRVELGLEGPEALEVGGGAERLLDHRARRRARCRRRTRWRAPA